MRQYLATGVDGPIMSPLVVFGMHAAGNMFTMTACVKPLDNSFALIAQPLKSTDSFMLLSSKSLSVLAADQESLTMLGVRTESTDLD